MSNERACTHEGGCPHQFQGPCYGGCQAAAEELTRLAQEMELDPARDLADHIKRQPLAVIQDAFHLLGMQLRFEIDRADELSPAEMDQLRTSLDQLRRGEVEPAFTFDESVTAHAEHLSREAHRLATTVDSVRATATAHLPNPVAAGVLAELDQHANGHTYLSTSCLHGEHDYCKHNRGAAGMKVPAVCKFCGTGCICPCHTNREGG